MISEYPCENGHDLPEPKACGKCLKELESERDGLAAALRVVHEYFRYKNEYSCTGPIAPGTWRVVKEALALLNRAGDRNPDTSDASKGKSSRAGEG